MKYFPDIADFDTKNHLGRVRYLAHCDFEPIKGLIEKTIENNTATVNFYNSIIKEANDTGDMVTSSKVMDLLTVFSARIIPLSYESVFLIMMSRLEEAFCTWCRMIHIENNSTPEFSAHGSGVLDKAADYIRDFNKNICIKQDREWEYITAIIDARNSIIHTAGRVRPQAREKMRKFNIAMREEDYSIYIDEEKLQEWFNVVVGFFDRVSLSAERVLENSN